MQLADISSKISYVVLVFWKCCFLNFIIWVRNTQKNIYKEIMSICRKKIREWIPSSQSDFLKGNKTLRSTCFDYPKKFIGIKYFCECDVSWGSELLWRVGWGSGLRMTKRFMQWAIVTRPARPKRLEVQSTSSQKYKSTNTHCITNTYLTFGELWYKLHVLLGHKMFHFCINMHYNV